MSCIEASTWNAFTPCSYVSDVSGRCVSVLCVLKCASVSERQAPYVRHNDFPRFWTPAQNYSGQLLRRWARFLFKHRISELIDHLFRLDTLIDLHHGVGSRREARSFKFSTLRPWTFWDQMKQKYRFWISERTLYLSRDSKVSKNSWCWRLQIWRTKIDQFLCSKIEEWRSEYVIMRIKWVKLDSINNKTNTRIA